MEPYPEQLAAARALLRGAVAEMATGEGKTIAAAFAAACWAGRGPVHVATANAYLAQRDAALLAPVYADLGLRTGVITPQMGAAERMRQYTRHIVYGTLAEFGFDYLRDRLVTRLEERVQRLGLGALIVDEADLLLIDEARTPLVIAQPAREGIGPDLPRLSRLVEGLVSEQAARIQAKLERLRALPPGSFDAAVLAAQLRRGAPRDSAVQAYFAALPGAVQAAERAERELRGAGAWMLDDGLLYSLDERARTVHVTADGQAAIEARLGPLFAGPEVHGDTLAALHNLLLAHALFRRDHEYLVREDRVILIEEATGRAAESRRYMHGLHAAIETKELGGPREETDTLAQISVQQLVRQYARRAGMTGTAMPAAEEFAHIYGMQVARIRRHRPNRRVDLPPRLYRTPAEVDRAVVADVAAAHRLGRPVLIGTGDVARSERLSALLTQAGLPHVVLNAREHAREAETIAAAGRTGAITIATNMAGRGTDIRLHEGLEADIVARTVAEIRRLVSERPVGADAAGASAGSVVVDCASPRAFRLLHTALSDAADLQVAADRRARQITVRRCAANLTSRPPSLRGKGEDDRTQQVRVDAGVLQDPSLRGGGEDDRTRRLVLPPSMAHGDEGHGPLTDLSPSSPFPAREGGRGVRFGLGLYVIATEAQANRRLDDQLRGRSGRQGDEGVTHLYASLEDDTLRFYAAPHQRAAALRLLAQRPFLEGAAARRLIDDAQRRAQRMHYGQRRMLFEFDLVIEAQRTAMLAAYERTLRHPAPDDAVRAFIAGVAAGEVARRPTGMLLRDAWAQDIVTRYGLPTEARGKRQEARGERQEAGEGELQGRDDRTIAETEEHAAESRGCSDGPGSGAAVMPHVPDASCLLPLASRLTERYERARAEAGARWPELARAAVLRAAAELWAAHLDAIDHLQRQAPVLYAFLPAPAAVTYAREASRRYDEYVWAVQAETLSTLLTLPQPYERPLPPGERPRLSAAAAALLANIQGDSTGNP